MGNLIKTRPIFNQFTFFLIIFFEKKKNQMQILGYNKDPCVVYQLNPKRPVLIFFFFYIVR